MIRRPDCEAADFRPQRLWFNPKRAPSYRQIPRADNPYHQYATTLEHCCNDRKPIPIEIRVALPTVSLRLVHPGRQGDPHCIHDLRPAIRPGGGALFLREAKTGSRQPNGRG